MELEYSFNFYFDEKDLCFYLEDKKTKFEDLYNKHKDDKTTKIQDNTYEINIDNYIYILKDPRYVIFILPNGIQKKVFISYYDHIYEILRRFNSYDFFYNKDGGEEYHRLDLQDIMNIYPVKKIKISIKQYKQLYSSNNKVISNYSKLKPINLSFSYKKYLKFSSNIEENSEFFNYTNERETFFNYLDLKLKNSNVFLPICGPEGIGKTSSILAYCKMKLRYHYFYFNVRTFYELLQANNEEEIKNLLIAELTHCLSATDLHYSIENILKHKSYNCSPIEFLFIILSNISYMKTLIIDQYKTFYDEEYHFLKELINKFQSSRNIILLSSMNEDDIKLSMIKGIKNEKATQNNFFLEYIYISKLAYVPDNYINNLSEPEKEAMKLFSNLYSIYYEIIEFKKANNGEFDKSKFFEKIKNDIKNNLTTYYKNEDKIKIYNCLKKLNELELTKINKDTFLKEYKSIPFRYIQININNKYLFKVDEIDDDSEFEFKYLYESFNIIINNIREELYKIIQNDENLLKSSKEEIKPIIFEEKTIDYIWEGRIFNGDKINQRIKVTSIYSLNDVDIQIIKNIKGNIDNNEGFILVQTETNAAFFDLGILVKLDDSKWKLYLIQITKKKESQERLTLIFLNDFFSYLNTFLEEKCQINIAQNYFCYIFDDNSKDNQTVKYCIEKKLDYLFYNEVKIQLIYPYENLKEYKMRKNLFKYNSNNNFEGEFEIKKYIPKSINFKETKSFLRKKRSLMDNKNYKAEKNLIERMDKKENYYNSINKNFNKTLKVDYNDREEEINTYLLDTAYDKKDLVGIRILIPNQKESIKKLNNLGMNEPEINNFFEKIGKDRKKFLFLNIKEIPFFIPSLSFPEYMTYIITKTENNIYYQDYENKKSFDLINKTEEEFKDAYDKKWKTFAISLISKSLSKETKSDIFGVSRVKKENNKE